MVKNLLGILGWLGVALVLSAFSIRLLRPELEEVWRGLSYAGLGVIVVYLVAHWRDIAGIFSRRQARYGTLSLSSVVIVLGILAAVNYIADRQSWRWDLTAGQQFSLSDQTRRVLSELDSPLRILVFSRDDEFRGFRDSIGEYENVSDQVTIEYIDVDRDPARARSYEVQAYGTIVVEYEDRVERITTSAEQDLTNAIVKAVEGQEKKVYFAQGHGEKNPASADQRMGYSAIEEALQRDNFIVEPLVLAQVGRVPEDASVVVIAGPTLDYLEPEVEMLRTYLADGGKLLMMLDPPASQEDPLMTNLLSLAASWGIEVGRNIVVDVSGVGQLLGAGPSVPVAADYPPHAITEQFRLMTAFPLARSVQPISGGTAGRQAQGLVRTSDRSWAESDLDAIATGAEVAMNEGTADLPGPVPLGAAVSENVAAEAEGDAANSPDADEAAGSNGGEEEAADAPPQETRVVVLGDSDFVGNSALGISGNRDFFLNTVNWLAQQENLIAIRARDPEDRRVTMTAAQQVNVFYVTVLLIPCAVIAAGIYTWWRRRG